MDFSLFTVLAFLHVMGAVIWIGGALVGMLIGIRLRAHGDAGTLGAFCRAFAEIAGPMFGGSSMLVIITGLWMVADAEHLEFGEPWVIIGIVGWLIGLILGAAFVGTAWSRAGKELLEGASLEATSPILDRAIRLTWIDLAIRIAVVLLMVWRPDW